MLPVSRRLGIDEQGSEHVGRVGKPSMIVPTLCVGMQPGTLCVPFKSRTRSVRGGIPTRSVGTINSGLVAIEALAACAYTGEIVASTPIKRVSAKNPPKKIAIFAMSTPGPKNCSTRAV